MEKWKKVSAGVFIRDNFVQSHAADVTPRDSLYIQERNTAERRTRKLLDEIAFPIT